MVPARPSLDNQSERHAAGQSNCLVLHADYHCCHLAAVFRSYCLGVARFIDVSIYRDTFPAIRIAILFFTIAIFIIILLLLFFFHDDFHLGKKDT